MKKIILPTFLLIYIATFSQHHYKKITINLTEVNIKEAIKQIELTSNYKFYFIEEWIDQEKRYTKTFVETPLNEILDFLFKQTNINYYLLEDKSVILTSNSRIYDSFLTRINSKTKYNESDKVALAITPIPTFVSKEEFSDASGMKVISIGKENQGAKLKLVTLKGRVISQKDSKPISDLILMVQDKNITTTTNNKGFYTLQLPYGVNIIETALMGYQKEKIKVIMYGNGTYNFELSEASELLDEIVIATNTKTNVESTKTGLMQIKAEEIKLIPQVLGERDILKIATTLPGILSTGEGAEGIHVRGGKSDQNLFLLDNATLYNPNHFLGLFTAINPFVTNDVKIFKGNIPAEYGGRISSVFDIIAKESKTEHFSGEASIGPVTSNLSLDIPIKKGKSGLLLAGRSTYSNWILRSINDEQINNSRASFYDLNVRYYNKVDDKNRIKVSAYYSYDNFSIATDTTNTYSNRIVSLGWQRQFNEKNSGNLLLTHSGYSFSIDDTGNKSNSFQFDYSINEINLKLGMKYLHSDRHILDYGISTKLYLMEPGEKRPYGENSLVAFIRQQNEKALESAILIEDEYTYNEKITFNIGARYSLFSSLGPFNQRRYTDGLPRNESTVTGEKTFRNNELIKTYNGLSFRFSTRYLLDENLSVKASFNNSYQFIHQLTNNTTSSPTDAWKLSDSFIRPQEALQASLGIYKNIQENTYEFSLEGYYKSFKNILDYKTGADLLLNEHIETQVLQGPGKSYGTELFIRKNKGAFNGWLSYTYSRSFLKLDSPFLEERVGDGNFFPTNFDKPHNLNLIMNYKLTKRFSFSGSFVYQSGRPITYPKGKFIVNNTEYVLYSERNKFRVPDYFRLDLGFNVEGNHKLHKLAHSFWNISVYNVLGRNNPFSQFFVTENGTVKAYQSSIFAKPIPTITYNFKF